MLAHPNLKDKNYQYISNQMDINKNQLFFSRISDKLC